MVPSYAISEQTGDTSRYMSSAVESVVVGATQQFPPAFTGCPRGRKSTGSVCTSRTPVSRRVKFPVDGDGLCVVVMEWKREKVGRGATQQDGELSPPRST